MLRSRSRKTPNAKRLRQGNALTLIHQPGKRAFALQVGKATVLNQPLPAWVLPRGVQLKAPSE